MMESGVEKIVRKRKMDQLGGGGNDYRNEGYRRKIIEAMMREVSSRRQRDPSWHPIDVQQEEARIMSSVQSTTDYKNGIKQLLAHINSDRPTPMQMQRGGALQQPPQTATQQANMRVVQQQPIQAATQQTTMRVVQQPPSGAMMGQAQYYQQPPAQGVPVHVMQAQPRSQQIHVRPMQMYSVPQAELKRFYENTLTQQQRDQIQSLSSQEQRQNALMQFYQRFTEQQQMYASQQRQQQRAMAQQQRQEMGQASPSMHTVTCTVRVVNQPRIVQVQAPQSQHPPPMPRIVYPADARAPITTMTQQQHTQMQQQQPQAVYTSTMPQRQSAPPVTMQQQPLQNAYPSTVDASAQMRQHYQHPQRQPIEVQQRAQISSTHAPPPNVPVIQPQRPPEPSVVQQQQTQTEAEEARRKEEEKRAKEEQEFAQKKIDEWSKNLEVLNRTELRDRYSDARKANVNRINILKGIIESRKLDVSGSMVNTIDNWFDKETAKDRAYFNPAGTLINHLEQTKKQLDAAESGEVAKKIAAYIRRLPPANSLPKAMRFRLPALDSDSDTDEIDAGRTLRDVIDNELQRVPTLSVELDSNDTSADSQRAIIALKNSPLPPVSITIPRKYPQVPLKADALDLGCDDDDTMTGEEPSDRLRRECSERLRKVIQEHYSDCLTLQFLADAWTRAYENAKRSVENAASIRSC